MGEYTLVDILISGVLALIMFGIGLSLTLQSFKDLYKSPRSVLIGLFAQMFALPFIAFLFCFFSDLSPTLKVGLMILAACPGGTTSNFVSYLMNGNTALSVAMTSINSFLTLVSIPLIVNFALFYFLDESNEFQLPYLETVLQIFTITIIPASIGVLVRKRFPVFASRINKELHFPTGILDGMNFTLLKSITLLMLAAVFGIKLLANESAGGAGLVEKDFEQLLPIGILFNIVGLCFGYLFSFLLKLINKDSMTIGIEVGLQNTTLAFLVAGTLLHNTEMQKPALVYAFFSFWTAIIFAFLVKNIFRRIQTL